MPTQTSGYTRLKKTLILPRIPLEGKIDLTYRCNNNCRHCWLRIPHDASEQKNELSFNEIRKIIDDARAMGCRRWYIFGGEPMLRPDFPEIFSYMTDNSVSYALNTNGSLITPKIAGLMKKRGIKLIALYGANAKTHDNITRKAGSFEAVMRGISYLEEANAGFTVQIVPMKDNYHEWADMIRLAQSLSKNWRVGANWLYLSACGDPAKNCEIVRQRLDPRDIVEIDKPSVAYEEWHAKETEACAGPAAAGDEYLFSCAEKRREFHIDPYGKMSFCKFIKDPDLRYDLKRGNLKEGWENFIPSCSRMIKKDKEYLSGCNSCSLRKDCRWCPAHGYLEHRRFNAKVEYLCSVADANKKFKENWKKTHRRYYKIADMTIRVDCDLPITDTTFDPHFKLFETEKSDKDLVTIRHHFSLPDLDDKDLSRKVYDKMPWALYEKGDSRILLGLYPRREVKKFVTAATFNCDYTDGVIYNESDERFLKGNRSALTILPGDQLILTKTLAHKEGCYFHSCGVDLNGSGLLFMGYSEAGKSTMATMLKERAKILCDDRIIVRRRNGRFKIYGTWSHGDVPDVSPDSAPLKAIFFLKKSLENRLEPVPDKREITKNFIAYVISSFPEREWWDKVLSLMEKIAAEVPCYNLYFDRSGAIADLLDKYTNKKEEAYV